MISVVIPTLNAERDLAHCLGALVPAVVDGCVREVIVADGGSQDDTLEIADHAGATIVTSEAGRGTQLAAGARAATAPWLLFVHADTVLEAGWQGEVRGFVVKISRQQRAPCAATFRFALDDDGLAPRVLEALVGFRTGVLGMPYGDQGLLISRQLFDEIGGYRSMPLMEDVDIACRLGRRRITSLRSRAVTSAVRYRGGGYVRRVLRNQACVVLYMCGVPVERIARFYEKGPFQPGR